jgi:hypothetical protein
MADKAAAEAGETVKKYPEATNQVLEYYKTKASEEEKKVLRGTIRKAAKSLKQEGRDGKKDKKKKGKGFTPPAPEAIAAALYGVLSAGAGGTVEGDPRQGNRTRINGRFDLNDVARKLMAALA